jgi:phenylalanine-4-hydroxylase
MNEYFRKTTGMFFRPTGGLLSEREFLNTLAFRVFPSTQYIRHASKPLYTPEPDIIHEFLGHAATFANKEFVEFSQEIGLASLGASNEEILRLATIYWYTVEFGLCKQKNEIKIYGGGILSSPSEIEHSVSKNCKHLGFDLVKMAVHPVNVTDIQTEYYLAPSFIDMKNSVKEYAENIKRPFNITFNLDSKTIEVDRKLESSI